MILAVNIAGDRAADRHVAGARGDRHEVAEGDQGAHERVEREAGVDRNGGWSSNRIGLREVVDAS